MSKSILVVTVFFSSIVFACNIDTVPSSEVEGSITAPPNSILISSNTPNVYATERYKTIIAMVSTAKTGRPTPRPPFPTFTPFPTRWENSKIKYELVSEGCTLLECLFIDHFREYGSYLNYTLTGVATITGYYVQREISPYEVPLICDGFVIVGGSPTLIEAFTWRVQQNNSINSINESGQVVMALELANVELEDRDRIRRSTKYNFVDLIISIGFGEFFAGEIFGCGSFVEVVTVR